MIFVKLASTRIFILLFFGLDNAALVVTTVAVGWSQYHHYCDNLCRMRRYTGLLWTVGCNQCTPAGVVHPQTEVSQTVAAQPFKGT